MTRFNLPETCFNKRRRRPGLPSSRRHGGESKAAVPSNICPCSCWSLTAANYTT